MRLPKEDEYGCKCYLEHLHLIASEIFTFQTAMAFKVKDEVAVKAIKNGADNNFLNSIISISISRIEELRNGLGK